MSRANQEKVSATNSSELNKIHSIIKNSSFKILETCIKTGNEFLKQAKKCDLDRLGLAPGLAKIETDTKALSELNNFFKKIEKVFKLNDDFKIMLELGKMTATDKSVMAKVKKVKMMYETTGEELNLMIDNVPADKKTQECLQMLIERNKNVSNCLDNVHETVLKICQELGKENVSSKALEESKNEATVNDVTDTIEKIQQSFCGGEKQNVLEKTPEVTQHSFLEMTNSTHNAQNTQNDIELGNSGVNSSEPSPKAFVDIKNQETKRNEEVKEKDLSSSTNRVGGKIIEVGNSGVNLGEFSTKAIAVVKNQQTKRNEEVEVEIVPPSTNRVHGKIIELRAKPATFDIPGKKSMENLNYNQISPTLSSTLIDDDNESFIDFGNKFTYSKMKNVKFDRDDRFNVSLGLTISDDDSDNHTDPQFHQSKSNHFMSGMLNQDQKLLTNVVERAADDILKALMDVSPPDGFDNLSGNSRIQQNFNPSPQQMIADTSTPELFSDSFGQSNDAAQNLSFSHRVNSARQTTTPFKDSMEEYLYHEGLNNNATAAVSRPAQSPHNLSLNTRIKMAHQNFLANCPDRVTPPNSPAAQLSHDRSFNTRPQRTPLKFTANDDLLENTSMPSGFEEYLESPNASTLNNRHQRARKALLNEIEDTVKRLADNLKLVDDVKSPPLFNKITTQNQRDQLSPYYKSPPGQAATSPKFLQFSPVQPLMEFSPHHLTPFSPYHAVETSPKNLRPASPRVSPYQGAQTNSNINTRRQRTPLKFSPNDDNLLEDTSMPSGFDEYLESPNATKNLRPPSPRVSPYQGAQATPKSPRPVSPRVRYSPRAVPSSNIRRSLNNSRSPPKNVERRRNDNNDQGGNLDNIAQIQEPIDLPLDQAEDEPQLMSEFQNWLDQGVVPVPWGRTEEPLHPFDDHEREFLIRGLVINGVNQLRAAQMILDGQYDYMN